MRYVLLTDDELLDIVLRHFEFDDSKVSMALELIESRMLLKLKNSSIDVLWLESEDVGKRG